jgi:hypothetical protein
MAKSKKQLKQRKTRKHNRKTRGGWKTMCCHTDPNNPNYGGICIASYTGMCAFGEKTTTTAGGKKTLRFRRKNNKGGDLPQNMQVVSNYYCCKNPLDKRTCEP